MTCDNCPITEYCYPRAIAHSLMSERVQKAICNNMWKKLRRWINDQDLKIAQKEAIE